MSTMRKEQFGVGTFVHIVQRGAHQMPIVRDDTDRWRFLRLIRYVNDENVPRNWERDVSPDDIRHNFRRPVHWPAAEPYVSLISHCLMDNHLHLLARERLEGGISKFMQRISKSMSSHHNMRHKATGTLFEGPYRARVITSDQHLQYLVTYLNIKNPFERFPGGLTSAVADFDRAYDFAVTYPFSSTADFAGERRSAIIDHTLREDIFPGPSEFRMAAKELMLDRLELLDDEADLALEDW